MASSVFLFPNGYSVGGPVLFPDGTAVIPSVSFTQSVGTAAGIYKVSGASALGFSAGGAAAAVMYGSGLFLPSNSSFAFSASTDPNGSSDTLLTRQAAGVVNVTTGYAAGTTAGVASFGPSAVASITVKGGIITAIS